MKKNILIIDNNLPYLLNNIKFPVGGATIQTRNWMYGFERLGYDIIIDSNAKLNNNSRYRVCQRKRLISSPRIVFFWTEIFHYLKLYIKYKPYFIYVSTPYWSNICITIAAKILHTKVVQRISNDNLIDNRAKGKFGILKYFIYKRYLSSVKIFLCQNEYQLNILTKQFPQKIIKKIYNPFLTDNNELSITRRNYVAWLGIFQYQKNLPALYTVAKLLPHITFRIAGDSNTLLDEETKRSIEKLRLLKNVKFVGSLSREQVLPFLSKAYCLLNTSRYEGFSNTYLEALSVGTPVVTTHKTDPDNIIQKYNLGKSVSSTIELPSAIEKVIVDKQNTMRLKDYVVTNHNPIQLSRIVTEILKNDDQTK